MPAQLAAQPDMRNPTATLFLPPADLLNCRLHPDAFTLPHSKTQEVLKPQLPSILPAQSPQRTIACSRFKKHRGCHEAGSAASAASALLNAMHSRSLVVIVCGHLWSSKAVLSGQRPVTAGNPAGHSTAAHRFSFRQYLPPYCRALASGGWESWASRRSGGSCHTCTPQSASDTQVTPML